ncbi:MAG: molybdopterin cofactor-binding domain-containing protein [Pseudomonas marincola]
MVKMKLTRRKFLIAGGLVGGGLAVAYSLGEDIPGDKALVATAENGQFALNAWVKINKQGEITVAISQAEMGQGIYTALCMLVAEELEVDVASVTPEPAPVHPVYANVVAIMDNLPFSDGHHSGEATAGAWAAKQVGGLLGVQVTGGSTSVRNFWGPMQQAGATAREMLKQAAASQWNVRADECIAEGGTIKLKNGSKSATYGELVEQASTQEVPQDIKLKSAGARRIIGKSQERIDIPAKVTGQAGFGVDVTLPNMAFAAVKLSPVFGGTVTGWDEDAVKGMPGFIKAVKFETGVAVIADSFWRAKSAVEALPVTFDSGDAVHLSTKSIFALFENNIESDDGRSYTDEGDTKAELSAASNVHTATYKAPFLAHACMEPMNCTAKVGDNDVEVWVPNQTSTLMSWIAEQTADVPAENVTIHNTFLGGGFGRRLETDFVVMAVTIAKALKGRPVKLIWTRENDIQHDMYRPAALSKFSASLNKNGSVAAWHNRVASPSVTRSFVNRLIPWANTDMPDNTTAEGAADIPYQFTNKLMEHFPSPTAIPVGYWRSVGHSYNAFFTESFMDELAWAAKADPVAFRMDHLANHNDFKNVLKKLAEVSDWNNPLPKGRGRGVALHESFGSIVGQVVEVTVGADKELSVDKVTCVVDCGEVLNPDGLISQMESGIIFGLSAALFGEITIENGQVAEDNFPNYDMVRLENCPEISVHIAASGRPLGGGGEPATPPIAPALTNAIFAANNDRIRELPLQKSGYVI